MQATGIVEAFDVAEEVPPSQGPELAVSGLTIAKPQNDYQPTNAGWLMIGSRGKAFQPE